MRKQKQALSTALATREAHLNARIKILRLAHRNEAATPPPGAAAAGRAEGAAGGDAAPSAERAASTRLRIERFVQRTRRDRSPPPFARTALLRELGSDALAQRSGIPLHTLAALADAHFGALAYAWTPQVGREGVGGGGANASASAQHAAAFASAATGFLVARGETRAALSALGVDTLRTSIVVALSETLSAPVETLQRLGAPQIGALARAFADPASPGGAAAPGGGRTGGVAATRNASSSARKSPTLLRECADFVEHHRARLGAAGPGAGDASTDGAGGAGSSGAARATSRAAARKRSGAEGDSTYDGFEVRFLLLTVTLNAIRAHDLTGSPSHL